MAATGLEIMCPPTPLEVHLRVPPSPQYSACGGPNRWALGPITVTFRGTFGGRGHERCSVGMSGLACTETERWTGRDLRESFPKNPPRNPRSAGHRCSTGRPLPSGSEVSAARALPGSAPGDSWVFEPSRSRLTANRGPSYPIQRGPCRLPLAPAREVRLPTRPS